MHQRADNANYLFSLLYTRCDHVAGVSTAYSVHLILHALLHLPAQPPDLLLVLLSQAVVLLWRIAYTNYADCAYTLYTLHTLHYTHRECYQRLRSQGVQFPDATDQSSATPMFLPPQQQQQQQQLQQQQQQRGSVSGQHNRSDSVSLTLTPAQELVKLKLDLVSLQEKL
jgi:hypothetical protein